MKHWLVLFVVAILTCGAANAADEFVGTWSSGSSELLDITREGDVYSAEFFRKNVNSEYEKVQYDAAVVNGALVISFDLGDVSARYDAAGDILILGGIKEFEKLPAEQAIAQLELFEKQLQAK